MIGIHETTHPETGKKMEVAYRVAGGERVQILRVRCGAESVWHTLNVEQLQAIRKEIKAKYN